ncbi:TPA: hypothetical protein ACX6QF_003978, partial [Photobacterium damselae]
MTKEINHAHRQVIHHIHKERRNKNNRSDIVGMWVTCSHFVRSLASKRNAVSANTLVYYVAELTAPGRFILLSVHQNKNDYRM